MQYEVDSYLTCQIQFDLMLGSVCYNTNERGIGDMKEESRFENAAYSVSDDSHPESDADFAEWLRSKRVRCEAQKGVIA